MSFRSIAVLLLMSLAGCATTPVSVNKAKAVPLDRTLAFQDHAIGNGTLVVTRDKGFLGGGCYYGLYINNVLAARFDTSETAKFSIPPGEHLLKATRDPLGKSLCSAGQQYWTQRETILRENETKYFRFSIDVNGKTDIQRADPIIAP